MNGRLIVFEGPDGVGKSTLVKYLQSLLNEAGVPAEAHSFPGDRVGTLGKLVYDIHHSPDQFGIKQLSPPALQTLHIAAHVDAIAQTILPTIKSGTWILLDRFWWSTWVYGMAARVDPAILECLIQTEKLTWGQLSPSVLFLVDRSSAVRPQQTDEQYDLLRSLYKQIADAQRGIHDVIHIMDADLERAYRLIAEYVLPRP
ncbi:MAG: hypothetical protein L0338_26415 [Acidobacteria bacterium]|nr:hypothetical protein [Acidobacteriota bacterium]